MADVPQRRKTSQRTIVLAVLALVLVVVAVQDGGIGPALVLAALVAFPTALYALALNRRSWARIPSRASAARVLAGSVVLFLIGGIATGVSAPADDRSVAADTAAAQTAAPTQAQSTDGTDAPASSPQPAGQPTGPGTLASSPQPDADAPRRPAPSPARTSESAAAAAETGGPGQARGTATARRAAPKGPKAGGKDAALAVLATLPVKGRAPKTGYDREQFGRAWLDVDRNGCDTRNDMLGKYLRGISYVNSVPCKVATGTLQDPYTGRTISFVRGQTTSTRVQIDHVVALSDAWQKGAQKLGMADRVALANDPLNLQPTDGPTNARKGDGDAATWLPPNTSYRCAYVARQVGVKAKYGLWVTRAEHDAMARILASCPGQNTGAHAGTPIAAVPEPMAEPARAAEPSRTAAPSHTAAPRKTATPKTTTQPAPARKPAAVYYQNCTAVRDAGADPIRAGEPGYSRKLDRDGDGVGCE
jgi:hypothetical protein